MNLSQAATVYKNNPELSKSGACRFKLKLLSNSPILNQQDRKAARFLSNFLTSMTRHGSAANGEAHELFWALGA